MVNVPEDVLLCFLAMAKEAMETLCDGLPTNPSSSLAEIRSKLLEKQTECLQRTLEEFPDITTLSAHHLQNALGHLHDYRSMAVHAASETMNEAARRAFCVLVLHSEHLHRVQKSKRTLQSSGSLLDVDVLEFCGLCLTAAKTSLIREHLRTGKPLFANSSDICEPTIFPQRRLEFLQRDFLRALRYDPDFGTKEIKRRFYDCCNTCEKAQSCPMQAAFTKMAATMQALLTEVTLATTNDNLVDGVTRVVSVQYSEKIIDSDGVELVTVSDDVAPRCETRVDGGDHDDKNRHKRQQFQVARQTSLLQQELLGELLSMRDEEREVKLEDARRTTNTVLQKVMEMHCADRVSFLTSLDPQTQRAMAMVKLWNSTLAANNGDPPKLR